MWGVLDIDREDGRNISVCFYPSGKESVWQHDNYKTSGHGSPAFSWMVTGAEL